jgi:hypothetical protein
VFNSIKDHFHEFITLITQLVVDVTALDEEHVHSNFKRHFISDFNDGVLIFVNFFLEHISIEWLLLKECFDSLFLLENEKVIIIDVDSQFHCVQVIFESLRNLFLGFDNKFIIDLYIPEMHFVTSCNGVFRSW